MSIEIQNVSKSFERIHVLKNINLKIEWGELIALLGPSGCGKTTLLRIIAGLESLDAGKITFFGQDKTADKARDREVGFVFQHYALFRHMTVFDNVAFGLRVKSRDSRPSQNEIRDKVYRLLQLVQMDKFHKHYPSQLSGGQRQRIALARALAVEPKVLLLDEPFGALDAKVRLELRKWLRNLHDQIHLTSIFVTHDQEEALEVADRIVVMNGGSIVQIGTPDEVYDHPVNPFVFGFLGKMNSLPAVYNASQEVTIDQLRFKTNEHFLAGTQIKGYFRPHELHLLRSREKEDLIGAKVEQIQSIGPFVRLELRKRNSSESIIAEISKEQFQDLKINEGEEIYFEIRKIKFFPEN